MARKDFNKRTGAIYALAMEQGISEEELFKYTEMIFSFLYLKEGSKQKGRIANDTRTESIVRVQ
jgi:hypothetical protein